MRTKILIVEDQFIEANNLKLILKSAGYEICSIARSVPIALNIIDNEGPDLVLLDIFLQGEQTGIDLAKMLEKKKIPFVFISANSNRDLLDAAKATKPYGFLVKPFRKNDVLVMLDVAWYLHQHKEESNAAARPLADRLAPASANAETSHIVGNSAAIQEVIRNVNIVSPSNTSVLILGENGTGKELVAQAIHYCSPRKNKPFIAVNCAALPASLIESELFGHEKGAFTGAIGKRTGKFEQAQDGTIFLDEIGELPLELQIKFLRVLQEKEIETIGGTAKKVNVRVVAATNRDLESEVASGRFRIDLYYRLNVFPIHLPPLRERKEDIPLLAGHFLKYFVRESGKHITGFSDYAIRTMMEYSWPGNVRELQNQVERAVLLAEGSLIDQLSLKAAVTFIKNTPVTIDTRVKTIMENERDHIIEVLKNCKGKVAGKGGAAELLGINISTLNSRIKKLGIDKRVVV
ncbi:MAG: sigma-54-dependent Fis family transcriptional regulator [Bacteroidetes bacterium]|nr:sigma-54-dependent Fis family transcriptional regulator [Bacteroidota bacterium]